MVPLHTVSHGFILNRRELIPLGVETVEAVKEVWSLISLVFECSVSHGIAEDWQ